MTVPLNFLYIVSSPIVLDGGGREGVIVLNLGAGGGFSTISDGAGREGGNAH